MITAFIIGTLLGASLTVTMTMLWVLWYFEKGE